MDNFRNFKRFRTFLEHIASFEDPEDHGKGDKHKADRYKPHPWRMTDEPAELDVHSEKAGDQGRRHEHERHEGEHLHDLVLVEVDDTDYL